MMLFLKLLLFVILCAEGQMISGPTVKTSVGSISGLSGPEFTAYLGIPYGVVDESNPFAAASPAPPFNTTYLAHQDPVICPQVVKDVPEGNIHCLHLNIYTPNNINSSNYLPVMVFIHGGGFIEGDGNLKTYSPKFLVKNNVIIVTLNYRLGPYGFLCLPNTNYSNQGLNDQALAFDWVKRNINFFGGNDDGITIFGHSAGSGSAEVHLLYNEKKVFNKVILQSGFLVSPFMSMEGANEKYIREIAAKLGVKVKNFIKIDEILSELSNIDAMKLVNITKNDTFRVCVDNKIVKKTPNINLGGIKVMLGTALKEMVFFFKNNEPDNQFFVYLPSQSISKVENFYIKGNLKDNIIDFGTDFIFNYPAERSAKFYEENAEAVYRYVFAYDGNRNLIKVRDNIKAEGATHGDELGYLFDADILGDNITKEDRVMVDAMTKLWTNFAKYGNPDDTWPAVEKKTKYYKYIGSRISTEKNFFKDKIEFWDQFYSMYGSCFNGVDFGEELKCMENEGAMFSISFILTVVLGVLLLKCL